MAFEKGGLADKLGNRYEGRWVAKQLLLLLDEKNTSVLIEAIGEDEKGVDLWVETKGGERQAHQCKARNTSKEYWSINTLKTRGILGNAKLHLDRNLNYEFMSFCLYLMLAVLAYFMIFVKAHVILIINPKIFTNIKLLEKNVKKPLKLFVMLLDLMILKLLIEQKPSII